jgi:hypothetical protein
MRAAVKEYTQLAAHIRASRELSECIRGARTLALLSGALDCGVLDALNTRSTVKCQQNLERPTFHPARFRIRPIIGN